jgi:hypothetical protein
MAILSFRTDSIDDIGKGLTVKGGERLGIEHVERRKLRDHRVGFGGQDLERRDPLVVPAAQLNSRIGQDRRFDIEVGKGVVGNRNRRHDVLPPMSLVFGIGSGN